MGYDTSFKGQIKFDKPLTVKQLRELEKVHDGELVARAPHDHCGWVPSEDGSGLEWDHGEKFYSYVEWMECLIENYIKPWGLVANGEVKWFGEEAGDIGKIVVKDNVVTKKKARIVFDDDDTAEVKG